MLSHQFRSLMRRTYHRLIFISNPLTEKTRGVLCFVVRQGLRSATKQMSMCFIIKAPSALRKMLSNHSLMLKRFIAPKFQFCLHFLNMKTDGSNRREHTSEGSIAWLDMPIASFRLHTGHLSPQNSRNLAGIVKNTDLSSGLDRSIIARWSRPLDISTWICVPWRRNINVC